jgi:hypothetical protein
LTASYVSEEAFLRTELTYTLPQIELQAEHARAFVRGARDREHPIWANFSAILLGMMQREDEERGAIIGSSVSTQDHLSSHRLLEGRFEETYGAFRAQRQKTLQTVEGLTEPWTTEIRASVRAVLAGDREGVTAIADAWREFTPQRQDE